MLRRKKCLLPDFAPKSHTELIPALETADGEIPARDDSRRGSPREPESSVEIELTLNKRTTALYTRGPPPATSRSPSLATPAVREIHRFRRNTTGRTDEAPVRRRDHGALFVITIADGDKIEALSREEHHV